jgi:hypothetical protein
MEEIPLNALICKRALRIGLASLLALNGTFATAQDFCLELVRRGVYNKHAYTSSADSYDSFKSRMCQQTVTSRTGSGGVKVTLPIKGVPLGLDLSSSGRAAAEALFCDEKATAASLTQTFQGSTEVVSPDLVSVLRSCADNESRGLKTQVQEEPDQLSMTVRYDAQPGAFATFTHETSIPKALSCTGPLRKVRPGDNMSNTQWTLTCTRNNVEPQLENGRMVLHPGGVIVVHSSAGMVRATMVKRFAPSKTRVCLENERCGPLDVPVACMPSTERPAEAAGFLWLSGPGNPDHDSSWGRTPSIRFGSWTNPECGLAGAGWHAVIGSCGKGQGDLYQRCVAVKVMNP